MESPENLLSGSDSEAEFFDAADESPCPAVPPSQAKYV